MSNPFRVGLQDALRVDPCVVVIFGATGDLTRRKLVPGLYNLGVDGLLPANFYLIGFARSEQSDQAFRESLRGAVSEHSRRTPLNDAVWSEFAAHSCYISGSFDDKEAYLRLGEQLKKIDAEAGTPCNRIFYCATAPRFFETIAEELAAAGLVSSAAAGHGRGDSAPCARVIFEKPFGHDLASARQLNDRLLGALSESQIYRIDHYLGKETVQNLLVFRFANGIFEPIWNHKYIDHVEISVCESIGVGSRAGYFDKSGILRDIVQNHVLQLLCLVALEPPVAFEANAVRDEKVKVLRSVRRLTVDDVRRSVVRARYLRGSVAGQAVKGYLEENGVNKDSSTDTYVSMELHIDNWRWAGVPFFLRAGKRLAKRVTEISIHFKNVPHPLFRTSQVESLRPNVLSFQIQPDEGISLNMSSKPPGPELRVQSVKMDFSYGTSFGVEPPEAYERLLLDAMRGDATLFTRSDEIEQAWDIIDPILQVWGGQLEAGNLPPVYGYEAGTWGPDMADTVILTSLGEPWRRL